MTTETKKADNMDLHPYIEEQIGNMLQAGFNGTQIDEISDLCKSIEKEIAQDRAKFEEDQKMFMTLIVMFEHMINQKEQKTIFKFDLEVLDEVITQFKGIAKENFNYEFDENNLMKFKDRLIDAIKKINKS